MGRGVNGVKRGVGWGLVGAQVEDARSEGKDGAQGGMAGPGVPYGFATDAILLGCETQCRKVGRGEEGGWGGEVVDGGRIVPQADILETEQIVAGGEGGTSVFAGAEQEVIGKDKAVSDGMGGGSALCHGELVCHGNHWEG